MKKGLLILLFLPSLVFSQNDLKNYEKYMPTSSCGEILNYSYFSVSFCEEYKLSEWTIHYLTKDRVLSDFRANRPAYTSTKNKSGWLYGWRQDPNLNGVDVSPEEYVRSGYDRAHLVPAGDMYFSQTAMDEAYFMTNATPQISYLNRGGFKALESKFRKWIIEFKSIIIISGCTPKITESHIGKSGIPVPKFFYKIFIDPKNKRSIAFLFPNAKVTQDLFDYVVSIDYLESVTGLDFFYKLSDEDELSFEIDTGNKK